MANFLDIHTTDPKTLHEIIRKAHDIKAARVGLPKGTKDAETPLDGYIVALIFEKPSTRTRVSFDVGVRQMGGETLNLNSRDIQLDRGESIADTARVLSRYVDLIVIRTFKEESLLAMAKHSSVPVINGLTDHSHPCQIMADIMTFEEHRGPIAGKKILWAGDSNNVCHSFLHAAGSFKFDMIISGLQTLYPDERSVSQARAAGANISFEPDITAAVQTADLIVTDAWLSMHDDPESAAERTKLLHPYQINDTLMARAKEDVLFMHCLPAHRGEEVTSSVLDGPQSVVFNEAENRLHVQKAIIRWCLGK